MKKLLLISFLLLSITDAQVIKKDGKEVKTLLELSNMMAEVAPEYAKKLPKKELPNFMVKLFSYLDSSAKTMIPDLELKMHVDTSYTEKLLDIKFKTAKESISDMTKSVIRLGMV